MSPYFGLININAYFTKVIFSSFNHAICWVSTAILFCISCSTISLFFIGYGFIIENGPNYLSMFLKLLREQRQQLILVIIDISNELVIFRVKISQSSIPLWNAKSDNFFLFYFVFVWYIFMTMVVCWYLLLKIQSESDNCLLIFFNYKFKGWS